MGYISKKQYSFTVTLPSTNVCCLIIKAIHDNDVYDGLHVYHVKSNEMLSQVGQGYTLTVSQKDDTTFIISGKVDHSYNFYLWYI